MTSNTINEEKNKYFDSTVNYPEWTTKAQLPESSHVTNNRIPLEKKEIERVLTSSILKKHDNRHDVLKPSTKFWPDEILELCITGSQEPDIAESVYSREDN